MSARPMAASSRADEVAAQLWVAAPSSHHADELTEPERRRWLRMRRKGDRDRFATGVALLRQALRAATGDPTAVVRRSCPDCGSSDHGAPRACGRYAVDFGISLSHSEDRVVVAVTRGALAVGVDIEPIRAGLTGIAQLLGTAREAAADLAHDRPDLALTTRWVRKEAILKAAGTGLRAALTELEISDGDEPAYVRHWSAPSSRPHASSAVACVDLGPAALGSGYVGALAVLTALPVTVRQQGINQCAH